MSSLDTTDPVSTILGVSRARVVVGELSVPLARSALGGERASIIYSDPPWGEGNLKYWRTHNGQCGHPVSWTSFLDTLATVVSESLAPVGHLFLEMGVRWVDELSRVMATAGFSESRRWSVLYGPAKKPLPNVLWYSGPGVTCDPTGMRGEPMTRHVIDSVAERGALVFDPCCGMGMTARCAVRAGMRFVGCELNPKRAAITEEWLSRHDPT